MTEGVAETPTHSRALTAATLASAFGAIGVSMLLAYNVAPSATF